MDNGRLVCGRDNEARMRHSRCSQHESCPSDRVLPSSEITGEGITGAKVSIQHPFKSGTALCFVSFHKTATARNQSSILFTEIPTHPSSSGPSPSSKNHDASTQAPLLILLPLLDSSSPYSPSPSPFTPHLPLTSNHHTLLPPQ